MPVALDVGDPPTTRRFHEIQEDIIYYANQRGYRLDAYFDLTHVVFGDFSKKRRRRSR
jgi:hypothetical protein